MGLQPQAFTYLGTHTYVAIIKKIEALILKASKGGGSVGKAGRREGKGKWCNFILISKNMYFLKVKRARSCF